MIVKAINHLIVLLHSKWEAGFQCWILDHGGLTYRNILVSNPYNPKDETVAVTIRSSDLLCFREDNASTLTLVIAGLVCSRAPPARRLFPDRIWHTNVSETIGQDNGFNMVHKGVALNKLDAEERAVTLGEVDS